MTINTTCREMPVMVDQSNGVTTYYRDASPSELRFKAVLITLGSPFLGLIKAISSLFQGRFEEAARRLAAGFQMSFSAVQMLFDPFEGRIEVARAERLMNSLDGEVEEFPRYTSEGPQYFAPCLQPLSQEILDKRADAYAQRGQGRHSEAKACADCCVTCCGACCSPEAHRACCH